MAQTKFGVEIFLNNLFTEKETKKVPLKQLKGLFKYEKRNSVNTFKEYVVEGVEIAQEIGRREGLLPRDYQIIAQISKATSFSELKNKIDEIANKNVKKFLKKYVLYYIKVAQGWWKNF